MLKSTLVLGGMVLAGAYFSGAFKGQDWSRTVGRPQAEVMASLATLDISQQPGAPGSDPKDSGGVPQAFRVGVTDHSMVWQVMSGDKVATTMTAEFKPEQGGRQTLVTAHVERGDAPDDFVAPAFRSTGITKGLFVMALEGKLNELVQPATASAETCDAIRERFLDTGSAPEPRREQSLNEAIGQTAQTAMRLGALDQQLRQAGCSTGFSEGPMVQRMAAAPN